MNLRKCKFLAELFENLNIIKVCKRNEKIAENSNLLKVENIKKAN